MKYMGSKSKIAKEILEVMSKYKEKFDNYVEPFSGGLNMMTKVDFPKKYANDINPFLIAMWIELQNNGSKNFPLQIDKELYNKWRNYYNKEKKVNKTLTLNNANFKDYAMCGWIGFMASFNGRFYDGGYSGHNVNGRDYISEQIKNTLSQVKYLKDIIFSCDSYDKMYIPNNSVIYCDIPYKNTKQYNLSMNFDYEKFYDWCIEMTYKGNKVFISEYWMPDNFECIWEKEVTNSLNQTITKKPIEKLFTVKTDDSFNNKSNDINDLINSGKSLYDIFDSVDELSENLLVVTLDNKQNILYNNQLISDVWFDKVDYYDSYNGTIKVTLKNKENFLSLNGNFLSPSINDYSVWNDKLEQDENIPFIIYAENNNQYNFYNDGKLMLPFYVDSLTKFKLNNPSLVTKDNKVNYVDINGHFLKPNTSNINKWLNNINQTDNFSNLVDEVLKDD